MIEEIDYSQIDWSKRHIDPVVRWAWVALTSVEPANSSRGVYTGWRTYPDGVREMFTVGSRGRVAEDAAI